MGDLSWKDLKGDALMDYLMGKADQRIDIIKDLEKKIESGVVTFKNDYSNQEAILHKSSKKEGVFQFTYFDKKGAIGDFEATSINEIATKIEEYGFEACVESSFEKTILAGERQETRIHKRKVMDFER